MEKKIKWMRHLIRHNDFLNNTFEEGIREQRSRGRPRANYFHDIKEKMGCVTYQQLKEAAKDRHMAISTKRCL